MILQWAKNALDDIEHQYVYGKLTGDEAAQQLSAFIITIKRYAEASPEHAAGAEREITGATNLREMYLELERLKKERGV